MSSLYVGNLSSRVRHQELETVFRRFGRSYLELKDGYGFVIYEELRDAQKALKSLQGRSLCGEQPSIKWAKGKRPFPRVFGRGISRGSRDKHQDQPIKRRGSLEADKRFDEHMEEAKPLDEVQDGSRVSDTRENKVTSAGKGEEWEEEEMKDVDQFDGGRWDPRMEDSPMVHFQMDDEENAPDDRCKEEERSSAQEKTCGSLEERRNERRNSRNYPNSSDHARRGLGRRQEKCYNCGRLGHVKWQCRSRPRKLIMFNGRKIEGRYLSGRGGFRGSGGWFRGMNGSRRMLSRDTNLGDFFARRSSRRNEKANDRRHNGPLDTKAWGTTKWRRHRSESPNDSSSRSRGKSKHKHKEGSKKKASRKRKRSSSLSPSRSHSSGSPCGSGSSSQAASDSPSSASSSSSSSRSSRSHSSSSLSHSPSSKEQSSPSGLSSPSSISRSHLASSGSVRSVSKSPSRSPHHLHSPGSHGIAHNHSEQDSRSSRHEDKYLGTSDKPTLQAEQISDTDHDRDEGNCCLLENQDVDLQEEGSRRERKVWSREAKKQMPQTKSDTQEPCHRDNIESNGGSNAINSSIPSNFRSSLQLTAECLARDVTATSLASFQGLEPVSGQFIDTKYRMSILIKEGAGSFEGEGFSTARLWPWEAILYRSIKRGPIPVANYERRRAQNEEYSIEDKFVRSSSGWWEKEEKLTDL